MAAPKKKTPARKTARARKPAARKGKDPKNARMSLYRLVPNMMTLAAMTAGMTSIQYAIQGSWDKAVIAIIIAGFIDGFDGAIARLLSASSKLGAELDTLSDFLCFGVAPATIMYLWLLQDAGRIGWIVAVVFAIATALRLARYNVEDKDKNKKLTSAAQKKTYFTGVPSPTGAGMAMLPLIMSLQFAEDGSKFEAFTTSPEYVALWMLLFAVLMVSRVPTFSTKQLRLHPKMAVPLLAAFGLLIAGLIHATWITLIFMCSVYAISIPLAIYVSYYKEKNSDA